MKKESVHTQLNFLAPTLKEQLNPSYGLYKLSHQIDLGSLRVFLESTIQLLGAGEVEQPDGFFVDIEASGELE